MLGILKAYNLLLSQSQNVHATGNALHTINEVNAAIHQGEGYHLGVKLALAPSQVAFFAGTPNSFYAHFDGMSVDATAGPVEIDFYRGAEVASGTQMFPINRRMDISSSSSMTVQQVVTLTTTGSLVTPAINLATTGFLTQNPAGVTGLLDGFMLNKGETYLIGLHNTDTASAAIYVNFGFLEPQHV